MATIKSFTSLQQSKKLAKILPLESADMYYSHEFVNSAGDYYKLNIASEGYFDDEEFSGSDIPAWSLAALLDALPEKYTELIKEGGMYRIIIKDSFMTCLFDNPVDACVAMIERLHELNLL